MITDTLDQDHRLDDEGRPAGGTTVGRGFTIVWQRGPLVAPDVTPDECVLDHDPNGDPERGYASHDGLCRRPPNGAFVEDVIAATIGRLEHYQDTQFECAENARALLSLWDALDALRERTTKREAREVEGSHGV